MNGWKIHILSSAHPFPIISSVSHAPEKVSKVKGLQTVMKCTVLVVKNAHLLVLVCHGLSCKMKLPLSLEKSWKSKRNGKHKCHDRKKKMLLNLFSCWHGSLLFAKAHVNEVICCRSRINPTSCVVVVGLQHWSAIGDIAFFFNADVFEKSWFSYRSGSKLEVKSFAHLLPWTFTAFTVFLKIVFTHEIDCLNVYSSVQYCLLLLLLNFVSRWIYVFLSTGWWALFRLFTSQSD